MSVQTTLLTILQIMNRGHNKKMIIKKNKTLIVYAFITGVFMLAAGFSTAYAQTSSYSRLYRGMRSLAMGGAFTAVGGDVEAVFYNPAGLHDMGVQINVLNPLLEGNSNVKNLSSDISDAQDVPDVDNAREDALIDVFTKNQGKLMYARTSIFPNVAVKDYAIGFLGQGTVDARLRSPNLGTVLEISGGYEYGPVAGASFALPVDGLRVGVGGKWIQRTWFKETLTITDLVAEDLGDTLTDSISTNSDFSLDLGLLYDLDVPVLAFLNPVVGFSILDITALDFGDGGKIPTRANLGFSLNPKLPIPYLADLILAFDIEDITRNFEQDKSVWKRVHMGAEAGFLDRHILLRLGLNQGYATAGAEVDLWFLRLGYTYYSEEVGAYSGQEQSTRHLVQLALGW